MQFYVHSGRLGKSGVPWAVVWGLFVGLLLCRYYDRALDWVPLVLANPLLTIAYGFAVGWATAFGAKLGHLRNPSVAGLLGGLTGLAALYFAWAYTPMMRMGWYEGPVWDFASLWDYVKLQYEQGSWSLWPSGPPVAGVLLVAVWLVEAALIVVVSARTARNRLVDLPYCEETLQWMKREKSVARLSLADEGADAKVERLKQGDLSVLSELPQATGTEPPYLQLELASIKECSFCKFLTVTLVDAVANEKGRVRRQKRRLLDKLQVSDDDLPLIRGAGSEHSEDSSRDAAGNDAVEPA